MTTPALASRLPARAASLASTLLSASLLAPLAGCGPDSRPSGSLTAPDFVAPTADQAPATATPAGSATQPSTTQLTPPPSRGQPLRGGDPEALARLAANQPTSATTSTSPGSSRILAASEASEGLGNVTLFPGPPAVTPPTAAQAAAAGTPVSVDAMVGFLNGKPVFASRFLAPLDAQMKQEARRSRNPRDFQRAAAAIIINALRTQLENELLVAEGLASLAPEQRQGLRFFLDQFRQGVISELGGTPVAAEERLREREGVDLRQKEQTFRDQALVDLVIERNVRSKVNPSWADVVREYERDPDRFAARSVAAFRVVRVPSTDTAGIKAITDALAAGRSFEDTAREDANIFNRAEGGKIETDVKLPYGESPIFVNATLNEAAKRLQPGLMIGPFTLDNAQTWLTLEQVRTIPARTLADADLQQELFKDVTDRRRSAEFERYMTRLIRQGTQTDLQEMTSTLTLIATERYIILDPALRPASAPGPAPAPSVPTAPRPAPTGIAPAAAGQNRP